MFSPTFARYTAYAREAEVAASAGMLALREEAATLARLERLEMLEHRRQAHLERFRQLADARRPLSEPGQHSAPGRVG